jgi:exonuclease III
MIISSYNVRGLGGAVKIPDIREMINKEGIDFLALQETKLETISDSLCHRIWGSDDCL